MTSFRLEIAASAMRNIKCFYLYLHMDQARCGADARWALMRPVGPPGAVQLPKGAKPLAGPQPLPAGLSAAADLPTELSKLRCAVSSLN